MAVIGMFIPAKDGGWVGRIRTLAINAKVRIVPNDNRENDSAPTFRVFVGHSRIGEAWTTRSNHDPPRNYLRVKIDDPSLTEPIAAAMFEAADGLSAQLVWVRRASR